MIQVCNKEYVDIYRLVSISFQDSESWIFCFVLANDGQGLLTTLSLRAAGQAVSPGWGLGLGQTSQAKETPTYRGA